MIIERLWSNMKITYELSNFFFFNVSVPDCTARTREVNSWTRLEIWSEDGTC